MELELNESYIAYKGDNPLKNFKFKVTAAEDLFFEGIVEEGLTNIELWKPYIIRLPSFGEPKYLEISPYDISEETRKGKFIILGQLFERRKFVRFNVLDYNIRAEGDSFEGLVENVSLGGMKIKVLTWKGPKPREGKPIQVKTYVEDKTYHFLITPVKVGEDFISSKFEKPAKVTSEFFYHCLRLIERETCPVSEKRKFRRFYVEHLNIIVDTPLGMGIMVDISLGGMKVRLKRPYKVDEEVLKKPFAVSCYIPQVGEEYIVETELVNKTREGVVQLKITRWGEDALKMMSKILELLVETRTE